MRRRTKRERGDIKSPILTQDRIEAADYLDTGIPRTVMNAAIYRGSEHARAITCDSSIDPRQCVHSRSCGANQKLQGSPARAGRKGKDAGTERSKEEGKYREGVGEKRCKVS